jgi:hypothetical protein
VLAKASVLGCTVGCGLLRASALSGVWQVGEVIKQLGLLDGYARVQTVCTPPHTTEGAAVR